MATDLVFFKKYQMISLIVKGGWVMIPILLMSVVSFYFFIVKFFTLKKSKVLISDVSLNKMLATIENRTSSHQAHLVLNEDNHSYSIINFAFGLCKVNDIQYIKEALRNFAQGKMQVMEEGLNTISFIASAAPIAGFLGTVLGMIESFMAIERNIMYSSMSQTMIAAGIYEALITTAAGLIVSLISNAFYNILVSKILIYKKFLNNLIFSLYHSIIISKNGD